MINFAKLKALREKSGLNQDEIAEKAGISQPHYSKIENGKDSPSLKVLERIAAALDQEAWEFLNPQFPPQVGGGEAMTA